MGNEILAIDESTQCITLPNNFCKITVTTKELIDTNLKSNTKLHKSSEASVRTILAAQNYEVGTINITILNEVSGKTTTYQSIDTVMNQDEVVKYTTEFLDSLD